MQNLLNPNQYFWNFYALPLLVVAVILFAIGFFVLKQDLKSHANQTFCLLCVALFVWLTGYAWMYCTKNADSALAVYRHYTFLGVLFIPFSVYLFSVAWLKLWRSQRWLILSGLALTGLFYALAIRTDLVIPFVERYFWGYYSRYAWVGVLFFATFVFYFFAAFFNFLYRLKHPIRTVAAGQIYAVIIAFLFAITGCIDFVPKIWRVEIYPFGYLSAFFWIMGMAYAIVKYKVMDIETVIHKTLLWGVTSVIFLAPIAFIAYGLQDWVITLSPAWFGFLAFCFMAAFVPYARFIQPVIDQWFQRRHWNLNQVYKGFTDELVHLKTLEDLANHILSTIRRAMQPEMAKLLLWDEGKSELLIFTHEGHALQADSTTSEPFFDFLGEYNDVVLADYVEIDPRLESIQGAARTFFQETDGRVAVPICLDGHMIGVIDLGRKANLKDYSGAEINFLNQLRTSAAIAISNSLRLIAMQANLRRWNEELEKQVEERTKELKEAQEQLIQAEKLATIGTLAGGVAHEINNPLAAIMTNAQMLLMENLEGDVKESVETIEEATKRCREIVQKLMKYSRKSTTEKKRDSIDINEVIEQTISFLRYQLEQENLKVEKELKASHKIEGNSNELSQVFTNLIMNAKDAVQHKNGEGCVWIRSYEKNGAVLVDIEDNGIGIPEDKLGKICDPFFTTKEVGKGTGLGLSIVQSIIQDHGAEMTVTSQVNKGTTIHINFPKWSV